MEQLPGAGGLIAGQTVLKSRPDGYTLLFSTATYVALQAYRPDTTFNLARDFAPVGKIGEGPAVLYVNSSLGVKTLPDLLKLAKERPGELNCGSTGPGTQAHLGCEMLRLYGNIDIVHVPYNGMGPALVDMLAGRTQLLFGFLVNVLCRQRQTCRARRFRAEAGLQCARASDHRRGRTAATRIHHMMD